MAEGEHILDRLYAVVCERLRERPQGSYVASLADGGVAAMGAKVREEAGELVEAAAGTDVAHIAHEAADLIFHAWVLLGAAGIEPSAVWNELERRFGTGGQTEKASRTPSKGSESC